MPFPHFLSLASRRLRFESLEDRRMLATYVVDSLADNLNDDGLTTLREAIALANADADADTIEFAPALFMDGSQTLDLEMLGEEDRSSGDSALVISSSVSIVGPGISDLGIRLLRIDAAMLDSRPDEEDGSGARLFRIDDGDNDSESIVSLSGFSLSGGDVNGSGGAILSDESLTITDVSIFGHHADSLGRGGAIYQAGGFLEISETQIDTNSANGEGGGIFVTDATVSISHSSINRNSAIKSHGGGVYARRSTLSLTKLELEDNTASQKSYISRDGGALYLDESDTTLYQSTLWRNSATDSGAGIYAVGGGLTVVDSSINTHTAGGAGGGIFASQVVLDIQGSSFWLNHSDGDGGGVCYSGSNEQVTLLDNQFKENQSSGDGGGAFLRTNGEAGVFSTNIFLDNQAVRDGGGLAIVAPFNEKNFAIEQSVFVNNRAANGGGIAFQFIFDGAATLTDTVITKNDAWGSGGGLFVAGKDGELKIARTTISENVADYGFNGSGVGGGIYLQSGTLHTISSIVADNRANTHFTDDMAIFPGAAFEPKYTLIGANGGTGLAEAPVGSPDANGNLIGGAADQTINPGLTPLRNYYGFDAHLYVLQSTSPAVDAGDPATMSGKDGVPEFDARGEPYQRVFDGDENSISQIDMGAVEWQPQPGDFDSDDDVDGADFLAWQRGFGVTYDETNLRNWKLTFGEVDPTSAGLQGSPVASLAQAPLVTGQEVSLQGDFNKANLARYLAWEEPASEAPISEPPHPIDYQAVDVAIGQILYRRLPNSYPHSSVSPRELTSQHEEVAIAATLNDELLERVFGDD